MNFFSARKLTGEATKSSCIRCGDRPNIVHVMLDPRRGKTLRMYECRCGERFWDDKGRRLRYRRLPIADLRLESIVANGIIQGSI